MRKQWTADDYRAIKGVKLDNVDAIKSIAKKIGRTYMSVYTKVWDSSAKKKTAVRKPKFRPKELLDVKSKVSMTKHYVIVKDYKSISLINGAVRIKL